MDRTERRDRQIRRLMDSMEDMDDEPIAIADLEPYHLGVCEGCGHHTEVDDGCLCRRCGRQDLLDTLDMLDGWGR